MTTEQFTYWLNGFFEISDAKTLNEKQIKIIKDHLSLVLDKQTPDRDAEDSSKELSDNLDQRKLKPYQPGNSGRILLC